MARTNTQNTIATDSTPNTSPTMLDLPVFVEVTEKDGKNHISLEMENPFKDEITEERLTLTFENNKIDGFGNQVTDINGRKTKGRYMLYVCRELKNNRELTLAAQVTAKKFKKKGKVYNYIAVDLKNLNDDGLTHVYIRNIEHREMFSLLVKEQFGIKD